MIEEAIRHLQMDCDRCQLTCECKEEENCSGCYLNIAIKALEKQVPKKPYKRMMKFDTMDVCPVCGVDTPNPREIEQWEWFCPDCGQAIDWSEE